MAKLIHNAGPLLPLDLRDLLGKYVDELSRKLDPGTLDRSFQGGSQPSPSAQPPRPIPWRGAPPQGQPAAPPDPSSRPHPWGL